MTERSIVTLEVARNELLRSGEDAGSFAVLGVAFPLTRAGRALDDLLNVQRVFPDGAEARRRAAHCALGALEEAYTTLQHLRHVEAYQVLLDIAYA